MSVSSVFREHCRQSFEIEHLALICLVDSGEDCPSSSLYKRPLVLLLDEPTSALDDPSIVKL